MQLVELKTQALRYLVLGDLGRAFRLYEAILRAVPSDLDARMKVADLCVTARQHDLARRVYAAVAFYDLQGGRPLHALVAAQALHSLGADVVALQESLAQLYGAGSPKIVDYRRRPASEDPAVDGKRRAAGEEPVGRGGRLAPPDPTTDVPAPMLTDEADPTAAASSAAEVASSTTSLTDFPALFPPVPLLSELQPAAFSRVLSTVRVTRMHHGEAVVREGEPGTSFFLVAAGHVRVYNTDALGKQTELARLGEGAIFGELALVAAQPRAASVEVVGEADLLELGADALRAAAGELPQLAEALDRFTRERLLKNLLATSPLFRPFSPPQRVDLARRFTGHDVAPGTELIREGDPGRGLYVVLSGEVEVVQGDEPFETTLATLRTGDVFGEIALVRGTPAMATVRAARHSTVLFLAREYFERLMAALPELRAFFETLTEDRLRDAEVVNEDLLVEDDERVLL
ncbi:MAG TPA: cyclic nucleotide-binding domain-containing protein [Polyangia bacterium]|nr:cyclic nucleotide-binding domain-containing protein [Polyangia bacterium]